MAAGRPDPGRVVNYSTTVSVETTIDEIKAILRARKARSITETYDERGNVTAVEFVYETGWGPRPFRLPASPDAVLRQMVSFRNRGKERRQQFYIDAPWEAQEIRFGHEIPQRMRDQAARTAWRTLRDWVEAQMALLSTNQVKFEQIFLPYALVEEDRTMFEVYENRQKMLGPGE